MLLTVVAAATLAGCISRWGPLAVYQTPPVGGGERVQSAGTLVVTAHCSYLDRPADRVQLAWPIGETKWDYLANAVVFTNQDQRSVTLRDAAAVEVVGFDAVGRFSAPNEAGDFSKGTWLIEPDASCDGPVLAVNAIRMLEPEPS